MGDQWDSPMMRAALIVALERAGGELEYTRSEFLAVRARLGEYVIQGEVDRDRPGEAVVRIRLMPSATKRSMPVS
jgi:hypothetical protein